MKLTSATQTAVFELKHSNTIHYVPRTLGVVSVCPSAWIHCVLRTLGVVSAVCTNTRGPEDFGCQSVCVKPSHFFLWMRKTFRVLWKHCSSWHTTVSNLSRVFLCQLVLSDMMAHTVQMCMLCVQGQGRWSCVCNRQGCQKDTELVNAWFLINFQTLCRSQILSCCHISHDSDSALWPPPYEVMTHNLRSWGLDGCEHLGGVWGCLLFLSDFLLSGESQTVQETHPHCCPSIQISSLVLHWMNGQLTHLFFCFSQLLFCPITWFDAVLPSLNLTL